MNDRFFKRYGKFLRKDVRFKRPMKMVFDCSNGYVGLLLKEVFKGISKSEVIYINDDPSGDFPGRGPNPSVPGALDVLKNRIISEKADLGVAFDGDADRAIFMDDKAREVDPDDLLNFYIEKKKPKAIVVDHRMGWGVREIKGINIVRAKVGNYYIKEAMIENRIKLGAERTGHYYFKIKGSYTDGAVRMSLIIASLISKYGKLSGWIDGRERKYFRTEEMNFKVADKDRVIESVKTAYMERQPSVSEMDGLTMEFDEFWFNIRPSADEPLLRLNIEARSKAVLQKELRMLESLIQKG